MCFRNYCLMDTDILRSVNHITVKLLSLPQNKTFKHHCTYKLPLLLMFSG